MSRYAFTFAGAHGDRLRAEGPFRTLGAAVAALARLSSVYPAHRAAVCRTRCIEGVWWVYRSAVDRRADRHGDAPGLAIATIERAPRVRGAR